MTIQQKVATKFFVKTLNYRSYEKCRTPFILKTKDKTYLRFTNCGNLLKTFVIIPDPFFVMYEYQVLLMGGVPVFVDTYPDFRLREEEFVKKLSKKTKLIVINSPNNPSGGVYPKEDLLGVVRIARERNLLILSDDIYDNFVFDAPSCPCIGQFYENTLTLGGFSKGWGMTGWRLGYAAGPKEILQQMITLQQYTFSSVNSFAQKAAAKALDFNLDDYIEGYQRKRDLMYHGLKEKFRVQKPQGAFYIFPEVPGGDGEAFVERLSTSDLKVESRGGI